MNRYRTSRRQSESGIAALAGVAIVAALIGFSAYKALGTVDHVTASPTMVERTIDGESSRYLVHTENEVFENTDSFWHGKFKSRDLQGYMDRHIGQPCRLKVIGWRSGFLSMSRNIIEAKCDE